MAVWDSATVRSFRENIHTHAICTAGCRLAVNPDDDAALLRVLNRTPRGLPSKVEELLKNEREEREERAPHTPRLSLLDTARALLREADRQGGGDLSSRQAVALSKFVQLVEQLQVIAAMAQGCGSKPPRE